MPSFSKILLILLCTCTVSLAQKADTAKSIIEFIPTGVRIGVDAVSPARAEFTNRFDGFEVSIDADMYRYYPTVEIGSSARNFSAENGSSYENDGKFWRAGIDVNFMKKDPEKNMFFLGARYARSMYSEKATIITTDPVWGNLDENYENENIEARWFELTTGLRIKVWKVFWMGYTCRFKFSVKTDESQPLLTTDVPGYGSTDKPTTWGFSYYLMLKVPVRKQK